MTLRVAINGFGRIGRNIVRALYENGYQDKITIVAINDLGDAQINAHLLKFDTAHGIFQADVSHSNNQITIQNDNITVLAERDPAKLPWQALDIDVVLECTGLFTDGQQANAHLAAGARKVLISAPAKNVDATIVYGVNDHTLTPEMTLVSNASCTTNCLAPVVQALHQSVGIESGLMTTIHAYTNDQKLTDVYHSDPYRARSATQSMIPTKTGAAAAIGLVIPELAGKLDGMAVRVPTINVSLVDFSFVPHTAASADSINLILKNAAAASPVLDYNELPLVSADFRHNAFSSVFDANHTKVCGSQIKLMAWYDNEWAFANRMLDTTLAMFACQSDRVEAPLHQNVING